MLHYVNENLYFYHIPKTGGRAYLHNELGKPGNGHRILDNHPTNVDIIVYVRCPVDRFLSCYYYLYGSDRVDHMQQTAYLKETPLKTLDFISDKKINLCNLRVPAHLSAQYRWHKNLQPESVIYRSFVEYRHSSEPIKKFMSPRVPLMDEPELDEITAAVKEVYNEDYEYFKNIHQASACCKEWL